MSIQAKPKRTNQRESADDAVQHFDIPIAKLREMLTQAKGDTLRVYEYETFFDWSVIDRA